MGAEAVNSNWRGEKGSSEISDAPERVREGEMGGEGCQQDRGTLASSEPVPVITMPLSPSLLASASEVLPLSFLY
jgi:hypothetical protein